MNTTRDIVAQTLMGLLLLFETSACCAGQTSAANAPELRDELISRVERDQSVWLSYVSIICRMASRPGPQKTWSDHAGILDTGFVAIVEECENK